jgi:hypothetical protein
LPLEGACIDLADWPIQLGGTASTNLQPAKIVISNSADRLTLFLLSSAKGAA